eukprot:GHVH01008188.1.p1 GENE.GHVH01008188.1~~GHVH01008188.1.p1  ORF type:complete len:329 (+),score=47.57 GHVH01008188.1:100-1086(+)
MNRQPEVGRLPSFDPITGTPIKYEYVDLPPERSPKRVTERKVGRKEMVEDVIVEIPEITYKDVVRKVPRSKEMPIEKAVKQVHVRQIQEVRRVPKIIERKIPKRVEVKGEPKVIKVVNEIITYNKIDKYKLNESAVVVAQTVKPSVNLTDEVIEVEVSRLTPKINFVDVHVALPIKRNGDFKVVNDEHFQKPAKLSDAQFNSLLVAMNNHLTDDQVQDLPFKRGAFGEVNVSPEKMNAILLNPLETQKLGIQVKEPTEIFPRGGRRTAHSSGLKNSHNQSSATLHTGLSQLSQVASSSPKKHELPRGGSSQGFTVVPKTPIYPSSHAR